MLYRERGFTFIEAFVSIAVIAVTAVLVVSLFSYMAKASSKGSEMTAGTSVCAKIVNRIASDTESDLRKKMIAGQDAGFSTYGSEACGDKTYYYMAEAAPVYADGAFSGMMKVTCAVFWFEDSDSFDPSSFISDKLYESSVDKFIEESGNRFSKSEYGFSYVKLSKIVCVSEN